jgi:hypothetical protein
MAVDDSGSGEYTEGDVDAEDDGGGDDANDGELADAGLIGSVTGTAVGDTDQLVTYGPNGFPLLITTWINFPLTGQGAGPVPPPRPKGGYGSYTKCFIGSKITDYTQNAGNYVVALAGVIGSRKLPFGSGTPWIGLAIAGVGIFARDRELATASSQLTGYVPLALQPLKPLPGLGLGPASTLSGIAGRPVRVTQIPR